MLNLKYTGLNFEELRMSDKKGESHRYDYYFDPKTLKKRIFYRNAGYSSTTLDEDNNVIIQANTWNRVGLYKVKDANFNLCGKEYFKEFTVINTEDKVIAYNTIPDGAFIELDGKFYFTANKDITISAEGKVGVANDGLVKYMLPDTPARRINNAKHRELVKQWHMEFTIAGFDKERFDKAVKVTGRKFNLLSPDYAYRILILVAKKLTKLTEEQLRGDVRYYYNASNVVAGIKKAMKDNLAIMKPMKTNYLRILQ